MSTQADMEELLFIVDETHEDKVCERGKFQCSSQAVWTILWGGHCPGSASYCLSCKEELLSAKGNVCHGHHEECFPVTVEPVKR